MRKKLIVHIGTPKTGSSFLQDLCVKNHRNLAAADICYPGIKNGDFVADANVPINGSNILSLFISETDLDSLKELLRSKLLTVFSFGYNTVLISDETFSAYSVPNRGNIFIFECLMTICQELSIDLEFIAYFRDPFSYLPSHWAQVVKNHKETASLLDFVKADKIPYWGHLLSLYEINKRVRFFSYEKEAKSVDGLASSFFNSIGFSMDKIEPLIVEVVNPSLSLNCLTALRLLNGEFDKKTIKNITEILTNSVPTQTLDKPSLPEAYKTIVYETYKFELQKLQSISS